MIMIDRAPLVLKGDQYELISPLVLSFGLSMVHSGNKTTMRGFRMHLNEWYDVAPMERFIMASGTLKEISSYPVQINGSGTTWKIGDKNDDVARYALTGYYDTNGVYRYITTKYKDNIRYYNVIDEQQLYLSYEERVNTLTILRAGSGKL